MGSPSWRWKDVQKAKRVYGHELQNLLIFPGDWHILKKLQEVLLKCYYHAALKEIAKESCYRAATMSSLEKCSNFKRTHSFLMQVWEALYLEMVRVFTVANPQFGHLQQAIETIIQQNLTPQDHLLNIQNLVTEALAMKEFTKFVDDQSQADDTWRMWTNFVLVDCFCYIGLFIAIRTSNCHLRISSLKSMAPLFSAYDRPCYQRILPNHIADIESYPDEVRQCFEAGGFTVKVTRGIGHAVALDEAHEMCINRDMKMAVVRPT